MLTTQLLRARLVKGVVRPTFIKPTQPALVNLAEALVEAVEDAADQQLSRGELEDAMKDAIGDTRSRKVALGLQKLLLDRCEFNTETPVAPAALRAELFAAARAHGPLALAPDSLGRPTAQLVYAEVAARHKLSPEAIAAAMYADLPDAQVLTSWRPMDAPSLLHRYNTALAQGVLLRATRVDLRLHKPTVARVRQLMRFVKFLQLVFDARREDGDLHLVLDGPASLFNQSTRYGFALARLLPAVLLQDGPWSLDAELRWGRDRIPATLSLGPDDGLRSHLRDDGAWEPKERAWFLERWQAGSQDPWHLTEDTRPIHLGNRGVVLPDFSFTDGERTAHLEICGFWRKDHLLRKLDGLRRHGPGNLILAVSTRLRVGEDDLAEFPGEVIPFANVVSVKAVRAALERVAAAPCGSPPPPAG